MFLIVSIFFLNCINLFQLEQKKIQVESYAGVNPKTIGSSQKICLPQYAV